MKRRVARSLCAAAVLVSLGMSGCGGGSGIEEGVPKDTKPGVPLDQGVMPLGKKGSNKPAPSTTTTEAAPKPATP